MEDILHHLEGRKACKWPGKLPISSMVFSGTPNNGTLLCLGILMGVVWETYHKEVPLLGVPENPTD